MLVASDPVRAQVAHGGEAEGEVERREQHVDAKGRPAVLAGQLPQALREGEGGRGGVWGGGRGVGGVGFRRVGGVGAAGRGAGEGVGGGRMAGGGAG